MTDFVLKQKRNCNKFCFKLHMLGECYYKKENMLETVGGSIIQVHMSSMKNEKEAYYSMTKSTTVNVYQIPVIVK